MQLFNNTVGAGSLLSTTAADFFECTFNGNATDGTQSFDTRWATAIKCTASNNGARGFRDFGFVGSCTANDNGTTGIHAKYGVGNTATGNTISAGSATDDADEPSPPNFLDVVTSVNFSLETVTTKRITFASNGRVLTVADPP